MLARDRERFTDCRKRVNIMPLGAAALAGTSYPIDRLHTAKALGFDAPRKIRWMRCRIATSLLNLCQPRPC